MLKHWKYPNLALLSISLLVTIFLFTTGQLDRAIESLGTIGYFGVFLAGFLFVSTFTIAPATALLYSFGKELDPLAIAIVGGSGAAVGDYLAYLFIKDRIFAELNPILKMLHLYRRINILHSKYFAWLAPVVGALIIASPLPDEAGLSLLGLTKMSTARFITLAFGLNSVGIYLVALAASRLAV